MPRIRLRAGSSPSSLHPIEANSTEGFKIKTSAYEGELSVYLKNFIHKPGVPSARTEYFEHPERKGCTWSIQARGRFLKEMSADDVLFGNVFDRSLLLPYGSGVALKFVKLLDPTLEHDLQGDKPWALSPYIATIPFLSHTKIPPEGDLPAITPDVIANDAAGLMLNGAAATHNDRRTYFSSPEHRQSVKLGPSDFIQTDFCYGYLSFDNGGLAVSLPIGLSFDLMKYWDGNLVMFVCCKKREDGDDGPGDMFWCVAFELTEEDDEADEEEVPEDISGEID